jgi:hypothetical protein
MISLEPYSFKSKKQAKESIHDPFLRAGSSPGWEMQTRTCRAQRAGDSGTVLASAGMTGDISPLHGKS